MNNLQVFILCAGEQKRFPPGMFKQMLAIDGKPLIERTIEQVRANYAVEPWIVVRNDHPFGLQMRYFYPSDCKYIFDSLQGTSGQWGHNNIVLLGDVYYTKAALDIILSGEQFAYGNQGEIFAIKFRRGEIVRLTRAISAARQNAERTGVGKMWNVYRAWDGIPQNIETFGPSFCHLPFGDDTQDFDRPECYTDFMAKRAKVTA